MTDAKRRSRLNRIARRVRYLERPPDLEPDAVVELATTVEASGAAAGARWAARVRGVLTADRCRNDERPRR